MSKTSPCIGVCKFQRAGPAGRHCIACSMTKAQKRLTKGLKRDAADAYLALVVAQQAQMGRYGHWAPAYLKRCAKKGRAPSPLVQRARTA